MLWCRHYARVHPTLVQLSIEIRSTRRLSVNICATRPNIVSYFDRIDRTALMEMLRDWVPDGAMMRLVGKCLHAGVLDGEEFAVPEVGTLQGSILSPLLGNVYLHHVLDLWFEHEVKPRLVGRATLVRYADDLTIGFTHREDAERVMDVLERRMSRFGLALHPDKTRLLDFRRPGRSAR